MGLLSFTGEDLKRFAAALKKIYGEKQPGWPELRDMLKRWAKAQKREAPLGMTFTNPPAPPREIVDEAVVAVDRFLAILAEEHGQPYVDDVLRRWRS